MKFALAPRGRREQQQMVAILTRQHVGLDLEAVHGEGRRRARVRREHALERRQLLAHAGVLLLECTDLLRELVLRAHIDNRGRPPRGTVFIPFFDEGKLVNRLTLDAMDNLSYEPDYKKCAVKVEKVKT